MAISLIQKDDYICIERWMIEELGLKSNELVVYAVIHGFSKGGDNFTGSHNYLACWANCTRQTVINVLKSLEDKMFITKEVGYYYDVRFCEYKINKNCIKEKWFENPQNKQYVKIAGWMVEELDLKAIELMLYAIIYGFSQDGENNYRSNLKYLAQWTFNTQRNVINGLHALEEKKLIEKVDVGKHRNNFATYKALPYKKS